MQESERDSVDELVGVGCLLGSSFPLVESLVCLLAFATDIQLRQALIRLFRLLRTDQYSAGRMIIFYTLLTYNIFCSNDFLAATTCLFHLSGK